MRRVRAVGVLERALLGAAMTLVALVLERWLARRARSRSSA
ncbi:MAG TPA: hypothetical protein VG370_15005 [Chloroflexota bacterium]|jgi:hypothetical protein|nr:hypothetical protein [Chloroflexota bacterium]